MSGRKVHRIRFFAPILVGAFLFSGLFSPPSICGQRTETQARKAVTACAYAPDHIPRGVRVDGVAVGGMQGKKAEKLLRRLISERVPTLTIKTPAGEYRFSYPQVGFSDNVEEILFSAEKNGEYKSEVSYFLCGAETQTEYVCANNEKSALDAEVRFFAEGFGYEKERSGIFCDREKLKRDVAAALKAQPRQGRDGSFHFPTVTLSTRAVYPKETESAAKARTKKISSFTTYFNTDDKGRSANIALAASRIDGSTVRPKEEFSFNVTVGPRSKEKGFQEAKVIQDGEFIVGYGGGVCQASTTLYNAAVLAGLKITARKAHSLAVHYVEPSRDAMVSSYTDFRFRNEYAYPVYVSMKVRGDAVTATFYGKDEGYRYEIVSQVTGEIPPPDPIERWGDVEGVVREGKAGLKSEAYLETYLYGKLIKREKLRADSYAPIRGVITKKRK